MLNEGDKYSSIMAIIHLYDAMRQERDLETVWPEADFVVDEHTPQKLIMRAAPTTASECRKILEPVMGRVTGLEEPDTTHRARKGLRRSFSSATRALELAVEDLALLLFTRFDRPDAPDPTWFSWALERHG